ncbi:MAG TPA: tetratricopeptide repeat protein [Polyangia bacterium]|jgi:tetratricopeptide (TPR) repeat protein|nr:tetratricopeptide repeat protein [Polyangia bacterium]
MAQSPTSPAAPIRRLPRRRPTLFVGRETLLGTLRAGLGAVREPRPWVLAGPEGVGTTTVASEYAHRYAEDYAVVWWVDAAEPYILLRDYAALAGQLDLRSYPRDHLGRAAERVRDWLESNPRWLLVFDGVTGPRAIADYLPHRGTGHVLVTSPQADWPGTALRRSPSEFASGRGEELPFAAEVLHVRPWTPAQAAEYVIKRTRADETPEAMQEAALAASETLCGMPMALMLATARPPDMMLPTPADVFDAARATIQEVDEEAERAADPRDAVDVGWWMAFRGAGDVDPAIAPLLCYLAQFAPGPVPHSVVDRLGEHLQEPERFAFAGELLEGWGLVEQSDEGVRLHPLVRRFARGNLDKEKVAELSEIALFQAVMAQPMGLSGDEIWEGYATLAPHALAAARRTRKTGRRFEVVVMIFEVVAQYFQQRGATRLALGVFEEILAVNRRLEGAEGAAVRKTLRSLGLAAISLPRVERKRAVDYLERALCLVEALPDPDPLELGQLLYDLGKAQRACDLHEKARESFTRALKLAEVVGQPDELSVGACAIHLAATIGERDPAEVRRLHELAIRAEEREHRGQATAELVEYLEKYGRFLEMQKDYAAARPVLERGIAMATEALGRDTHSVADMSWALGRVLTALGDLVGATKSFERALAIKTARAVGPDREIGSLHWLIGEVFDRRNELGEAETHYQKALAIYRQVRSADHPAIGSLHAALGWVAQRRGRIEEALTHYRKAEPVLVRNRGFFTSGELVQFACRVASLWRTKGDLDSALQWLDIAERHMAAIDPPDPRLQLQVLAEQGQLWRERGDLPRAWELFAEALSLTEPKLGADHPQVRALKSLLSAGTSSKS